MRLAKYLASAGVASRRASEEIVRAGRITVDGEIVTDPARDVAANDDVLLDGHPISPETERLVYVVNKPAGVVSTARDTHGRPTVVSLVRSELRLYPVGRLDADTTGLILLTNDGELAHRLTHPSFEVPKTYLATISNAPVGDAALKALRKGIELDDGRTAPARGRKLTPDPRGHDPRGAQAAGQADVRRGRASGHTARADPVRPAGAGRPEAWCPSPAERLGGARAD